MSQCEYHVVLVGTEQLLYCVLDAGHKEHHRPDPVAWQYLQSQKMWRPNTSLESLEAANRQLRSGEESMNETKPINEDWLAEQIAAHWGEHGAHADIYGILLKKARWAEDLRLALASLFAWAVHYKGLKEDSDIGSRAGRALANDPFPLTDKQELANGEDR